MEKIAGKKKKNWEIREAVFQFIDSKIKEQWISILFPPVTPIFMEILSSNREILINTKEKSVSQISIIEVN